MKRLLSVIVAFALIVTTVPYSGAFTAKAYGAEKEKPTYSYEWINPIYEDVEVTEGENDSPSFSTFADSRETTYLTTAKAAGEVLREGMVYRAETVSVNYKVPASQTISQEWFEDLSNAIFAEAFKHTGVPEEGDSLRYAVDRYMANASMTSDGKYYYVTMTFTIYYNTTYAQEEALTAEVDNLIAQLNVSGASDYDKIKAIYDYMCKNIAYDYDGLAAGTDRTIYSAYAALVKKKAVCQGYAILFYRLALEMGLDARVITGTSSGEGHAWNIVKLENKYYNLDATWDAGRTKYDYFLKGSKDFSDHTSDEEFLSSKFTSVYPISKENFEIIKQGTCGDNVRYILYSNGNLVMSGSGSTGGVNITGSAANDAKIKNVTVGEGITGISDNLFGACCNMTSVSLPASLKQIGANAFSGCNNLQDVSYSKSKEDFLKVKIGESNGNFANARKHYNCTGPSIVTSTVKPTCAKAGFKKTYCANCNLVISTVKLNPTGAHTWSKNYIVDKAATCTAAGSKHKTCTVCGYKVTAKIPKVSHTYKTRITKATATKNGYIKKVCKCGAVQSTSKIYYPKTVKLSTTTYTYNGKAKTPTVKVYNSAGKQISSSNYTVKYASGRKNVGKYKVTVTFKSTSKYYSGSKVAYLKINPKGTYISSLTKARKAFTVKWKKQSTKMAASRITGYQVRYSTSSKMTNAKTVTVKGYSKTSRKISKLKARKTYYVQVRTYKTVSGTNYYSSWSKAKAVKTK